MADLQSFKAKLCYTAAALILHEGKVLFIKHKKIGIWFAPGGHIENGELPHKAAEREAFEETSVRVTTFDPYYAYQSASSEYVPSAFETNLHWVSEENYKRRLADGDEYEPVEMWNRGCEQHLGSLYLARPDRQYTLQQNLEETDGIGWFSLAQVMDLETTDDVRQEVRHAFKVMERHW